MFWNAIGSSMRAFFNGPASTASNPMDAANRRTVAFHRPSVLAVSIGPVPFGIISELVRMNRSIILAAAALMALVSPFARGAQDQSTIYGKWLTQDQRAIVEIGNCGDKKLRQDRKD
jgi:hypothetical protein